jgi:hypothetical protein
MDVRLVAAIVTMLAELPAGQVAREGVMYAALMGRGYSLGVYQAHIECLVAGGLAVRGPAHALSVTDKGRELAAKIEMQLRPARGGN